MKIKKFERDQLSSVLNLQAGGANVQVLVTKRGRIEHQYRSYGYQPQPTIGDLFISMNATAAFSRKSWLEFVARVNIELGL